MSEVVYGAISLCSNFQSSLRSSEDALEASACPMLERTIPSHFLGDWTAVEQNYANLKMAIAREDINERGTAPSGTEINDIGSLPAINHEPTAFLSARFSESGNFRWNLLRRSRTELGQLCKVTVNVPQNTHVLCPM